MLLILFIVVPITVLSNATICSHFGYNWAAEIRCLRSQLTLCQSATESVVRGARMIDEQDSSRVSMQFVPLANFYRSPSTLLKPDSLFDRLMTNVTQYFDRGFIEMKDKLEEEQKRRISELQGGLESGQRIIENRYDRKSAEMKRNFEAEVKKITKRLNLLAARVHRFGPFEYIYIEERESWYVAEEQCVLWGGHLASISSSDENNFVASILRSESSWIGLNDVQLENAFVYSDKSVSTYRHFAPGQPDNADHNENCVELSVSGMWSDLFCLVTRPYICKR